MDRKENPMINDGAQGNRCGDTPSRSGTPSQRSHGHYNYHCQHECDGKRKY